MADLWIRTFIQTRHGASSVTASEYTVSICKRRVGELKIPKRTKELRLGLMLHLFGAFGIHHWLALLFFLSLHVALSNDEVLSLKHGLGWLSVDEAQSFCFEPPCCVPHWLTSAKDQAGIQIAGEPRQLGDCMKFTVECPLGVQDFYTLQATRFTFFVALRKLGTYVSKYLRRGRWEMVCSHISDQSTEAFLNREGLAMFSMDCDAHHLQQGDDPSRRLGGASGQKR